MPVATAVVALTVLAVLPRQQPPTVLDGNPAVADAGQFALELEKPGSRVTWGDDATGVSGQLMPLKVFRNADGDWCRNYLVTVQGRNDEPTTLMRTACRGADGSWLTVEGGDAQIASTR